MPLAGWQHARLGRFDSDSEVKLGRSFAAATGQSLLSATETETLVGRARKYAGNL